MLIICTGFDDAPPPRMSSTIDVVADVPPVTHSSRPCTPSSAAKKSRAPSAAPDVGLDDVTPGLTSWTRYGLCAAAGAASAQVARSERGAVSYTHLTRPTS